MAQKDMPEDYEMVVNGLKRLYAEFPKARVLTEMIFRDDRSFIVKAELYLDPDDPQPYAIGHAEEIVGQGFVNKTSALENCETSAIGRAISNSRLCLTKPVSTRPSQEEMDKVQRYKEAPRKPLALKVNYTPEQVTEALSLAEHAKDTVDMNDLRELWTKNTEHLDIPINGTTLKDIINARVKDLA